MPKTLFGIWHISQISFPDTKFLIICGINRHATRQLQKKIENFSLRTLQMSALILLRKVLINPETF